MQVLIVVAVVILFFYVIVDICAIVQLGCSRDRLIRYPDGAYYTYDGEKVTIYEHTEEYEVKE